MRYDMEFCSSAAACIEKYRSSAFFICFRAAG
jgi:hypothetical protein